MASDTTIFAEREYWPSSHMSVLHLLHRMFQRHLTSCPPLEAMSMLSSKSEITNSRQGWHWIMRQTPILKLAVLALTYNSHNMILYLRNYTHTTPSRTGIHEAQDPHPLPRLTISFLRRPMVRINGPLAMDWSSPIGKSLGMVRTNNLLIGPGPLGAGLGILRIQSRPSRLQGALFWWGGTIVITRIIA